MKNPDLARHESTVADLVYQIGVYGITLLMARACNETGGLPFVKECVRQVEPEDADRPGKRLDALQAVDGGVGAELRRQGIRVERRRP